MNILIADKLSRNAIVELEQSGFEVRADPALSAEDLPNELHDTQVLIVRSTKVSAEAIAKAPSLSLIVRAGAGVNTIDLDAASAAGVFVANCPGKNADAVAELAIGLMIAADRRIADATSDLRSGAWKKKEYQGARGLKGRTLGILGYGTIGRAVGRIATSIGMNVLVWSRSMTESRAREAGVTFAPTPQALASGSDVVSVHLASTPKTIGLVGREFLSAMSDGSILVNTSRGNIVDQTALEEAISGKNLRVALDVWSDEPGGGTADFPAAEFAATVTGTPHIGASTEQASEAIAAETVRIVREFARTGVAPNVVNVDESTTTTHVMVVRHFNRVGVLAGVLDALRENDVNVEEMQNTIFSGGEAACATLRLDSRPSEDAVAAIRQSAAIIAVRLEARAN